MTTRTHAIEGWQDMIELIVAFWLILSPFALGFFDVPTAGGVAVIIGTIAFLTSQLGLANQQPWEEWFNLLLAIILIFSPWLLGYSAVVVATTNAVITGAVLGMFAIASMKHEYAERRMQRARTTGAV